jgi:glycosyltransferase involved in cell wall biosynthesis
MRVVVLMSTFQGEEYVTEQIASILAQLPEDGRVLIRDDGSRDGTVSRIEAFHDPRISVTRGTNVGFLRSFLLLLQDVPTDGDMFMWADQDDVWLPGKVERSRRYLEGRQSTPALYCSRLRLADRELNPIGMSPALNRGPSFENALVENIVTGCTTAFNRAALDLVRKHGDIELLHFHDWWLYLVVAAFGDVYVDAEPTVLYRQHGGNAIGMGAGLGRYLTILRFLSRTNFVHIMFNQIENFRTLYAQDLRAEQMLYMKRYFDPHDFRAIIRFLFSLRRHRQRLLEDFLLRGMVVLAVLSGRGLLPRGVTASSGL